jgi:hypothetical protein
LQSVKTTFEEQLESFQKDAGVKYLSALGDMQDVELSGWFNRLLGKKILPALKRIGFDEPLARGLFKMASRAWELMGPITDKAVWFHPVLIKTVEEARRGIQLKARRSHEYLSVLEGMNSQGRHSLIKRGMHPQNLSSLLEDISTHWIILPRVYDHVEQCHSGCLLAYLKCLDNEVDSEVGKIFARIVTEFVGNYTLKYMNEIHPKDRMIDALFYGYVAMFWKNLRTPPLGLEHIGVFDNFLRWAKILQKKAKPSDWTMAKTVENMEKEKDNAFPVFNAFGLTVEQPVDTRRFLVTLRHGYRGIETVAHYIGTGGMVRKTTTNGRLPYVEVPTTLSVLFREIKRRYFFETPGTQEFIGRFLLKLRAGYDFEQTKLFPFTGKWPDQLRFVGPRVLRMIDELRDSLQ